MGGSSSSDEGGNKVSRDKKDGKSSFRIGGGVGGLFDSYMATKTTEGNSSLPDSMKASTLLELIASERNWGMHLITDDLKILEKNRLYTVSDLRVLSKESWKCIELLPIVKDLIRGKIYKGYKKSKNKKKYRSSSESSAEEPLEIPSTNETKSIISNNGNGTNVGQSKPAPNSIIAKGNRIQVTTSSGVTYEADRYCPHKSVDLVKRGAVSGETLICLKHDWKFDLKNGGKCTNKPGRGIAACKVNDW